MSVQEIMAQTSLPITISSIVHDLKKLGIEEGDTVLVHSSLSSLGWVCGGPQAVVEALLQSVGASGTVVMPAHSGDWSDPAEWMRPPVPQNWIEIIYREWPAFDQLVSPTRGMGRIAELFRTFPGTARSSHPQVSFCANGKHADTIVTDHELTPQFGMNSPLGKLYHLHAKVLLLGVGYDSCTSLHLAEARFENMPTKKMGAAIFEDGERVWKWFNDFEYDSDDFPLIGEQLDKQSSTSIGNVGNADCRLLDLKAAVDYAKHWLDKHRMNR